MCNRFAAVLMLCIFLTAGSHAETPAEYHPLLAMHSNAQPVSEGVYRSETEHGFVEFAFGIHGMQWALTELEEKLVHYRAIGNREVISDLVAARDMLVAALEKSERRRLKQNDTKLSSQYMCGSLTPELYAWAYHAGMWAVTATARAGFQQQAFGPPNPAGPVWLYTYAHAGADGADPVTQTHYAGPFSVNGTGFMEAPEANAYVGMVWQCRWSQATAQMYVENCWDNEFVWITNYFKTACD